MSPKFLKFLTIKILILINIGWIILSLSNSSLGISLTTEDNLMQWGQFFFLIATAFYLFRIVLGKGTFYQEKKITIGFSILLILTIILACEEISWGQRIFNISTPDFIAEVNVQNEITLHNLFFFQRYRHWLLILFSCTGLTLIYLRKYRARIDEFLMFFWPPAFLKTAFVLILISGIFLEIGYLFHSFYWGDTLIRIRFWAGRFSEIGETGVSITAFAYAGNCFNSIVKKHEHL